MLLPKVCYPTLSAAQAGKHSSHTAEGWGGAAWMCKCCISGALPPGIPGQSHKQSGLCTGCVQLSSSHGVCSTALNSPVGRQCRANVSPSFLFWADLITEGGNFHLSGCICCSVLLLYSAILWAAILYWGWNTTQKQQPAGIQNAELPTLLHLQSPGCSSNRAGSSRLAILLCFPHMQCSAVPSSPVPIPVPSPPFPCFLSHTWQSVLTLHVQELLCESHHPILCWNLHWLHTAQNVPVTATCWVLDSWMCWSLKVALVVRGEEQCNENDQHVSEFLQLFRSLCLRIQLF